MTLEAWLKKAIRDVLQANIDLQLYKPFYFGSRVQDNNTSRSDIDLGVLGPAPIPVRQKLDIIEALENLPTLYKIDLVDFATVSEQFKKEAMKFIEPIQ